MNFDGFFKWLCDKRKMGERSARDVVSRLKRVLKITGDSKLNNSTLKKLNSSSDFSECSPFIKSQLKRAVILYLEFLG